ncbi:MAG: RagB/SusD family nutrient uptake outer membrane protein [Prolixibacteraceae bacterium]|jgi:hypothetical protein|nr:RagB/SusD family nutrient uptake outer membrane protein [Prolixibacteraceae bacterium]
MKTKIFIIAFSIIVLLSCDLEEKILDTPAPSNFLTLATDLDNLIGGMYGYLQSAPLYKGETVETIIESPTDYMITIAPGTKVSIGQRAYSSSQIEFKNAWASYYKIIGNANQLIDIVEKIDLTTDEYNKAKGQGHFIRAFCYFNLVRFFGGVPLYTEPTGAKTDFYAGRNTVDEVYQQIFTDFKEASGRLLPKSQQPSTEMSHGNKGSADAFLALAYLTYGNYLQNTGQSATDTFTKSKQYADAVINSNEFQLLTDFGNLWDVNKESEAYKEVIFGITFTVDGSVTGKSSKGSELAHIFTPSTAGGVAGYGARKQGWGHYKMQAWFYDLCTTGEYAGDYRAEKSFMTTFIWRDDWGVRTPERIRVTYPDINPTHAAENFPYIGKYTCSFGLPNNDENDFFILRLAEVYLIKAEAENELNGPTADAYTAFNKLRERARNANGVVRTTPANLEQGLSKEEFRLKIFHERGIELMGEGHRWFDLVRMKAPSGISMYQYMHEFVTQNYTAGTPTYNTSTKKWSAGRYDPKFIPAFQERYLLHPIPANEISINSNMEQNPGW